MTFGIVMTSCVDDVAMPTGPDSNESEIPSEVYSLSFSVRLDNMGGIGSRAQGDPEEITKWENYINPERFRVLFFDNNDKFLFESKNRYLKEMETHGGYNTWLVSIPLSSYGNDTYFEDGTDYNWDAIRTHLTTQPFKIAILANRPTNLQYPGFTDSELSLPDGVFANDGPNWGPSDVGKRDVFDLHHVQYDVIYADKGTHSDAAKSYYDFIMGDITSSRPTMGASVNWVSFDNGDTDKEQLGSSSVYLRNLKMPSKEHPIPMYGIQRFDPVPAANWIAGTPFDISNMPGDLMNPDVDYNYKSISLLRSCVRLDLKIPKSAVSRKPQFVSLWYSNIYSRTEPMDVWTPTDELWGELHDNKCELSSIINYGPVSNTNSTSTTKADYQKRLSWFYGAWKEKGWQFKTRQNTYVSVAAENKATTPYPRIFNTCIQRNKAIRINNGDVSDYYNDGYYHWIVYTGERNMNDPNTLPNLGKNPYIATFIISLDNSKYYCIPLLDYDKNNDADLSGVFGPHTDNMRTTGNWPTKMDTYVNSLYSEKGSNLPYQLLRNHIYEFTLTGTKSSGGEDIENMMVMSNVHASENI